MVTVPYVLIDCQRGGKSVARAAVSSTWAGVVAEDEADVMDITEELVTRNVDGDGWNLGRVLLVDKQLAAISKISDGSEVSPEVAPDVVYALQAAVPSAARFIRAGSGADLRVTTTEIPVRDRLASWLATGDARQYPKEI